MEKPGRNFSKCSTQNKYEWSGMIIRRFCSGILVNFQLWLSGYPSAYTQINLS